MAPLPEPIPERIKKGRVGKIQLADGGTLFLDEIAEMPLAMQAKLLRVLQEREVEALGSNRLISVDVRVIAATSKNMAELVQQGEFRADLYYRLNVLPIDLPPLRQRTGDIPVLAQHLLLQIQKQTHLPPLALSQQAINWLESYHWPGNVRELRNRLERACVMAEGDQIYADDFGIQVSATSLPTDPLTMSNLPQHTPSQHAPSQQTASAQTNRLQQQRQQSDFELIQQAIRQHNGNRTAAAKSLGISRATLYNRLKKAQTV